MTRRWGNSFHGKQDTQSDSCACIHHLLRPGRVGFRAEAAAGPAAQSERGDSRATRAASWNWTFDGESDRPISRDERAFSPGRGIARNPRHFERAPREASSLCDDWAAARKKVTRRCNRARPADACGIKKWPARVANSGPMRKTVDSRLESTCCSNARVKE